MCCATSPERSDPDTTLDTVLGGRLRLRQPRKGHRVGHDAILLAALAPEHTRHLVDLGAGVGSAGLAVLVRQPAARGVLVEIDPALAALADENVQDNGLGDRCTIVTGDVRTLCRPIGPPNPAPGAADLVLTNPPFNARASHQTSPDPQRATAHMAEDETLADWGLAAYRCLAPGGTLALILRPEDLGALLDMLRGRFGAAQLLPVHPAPHAPAVRLLVRAIKGRRTPPVLLPGLILADSAGRPTAEAEAVLRDGTALMPQR